ncbi:hypothetical protein QF001_000433 [Paraburkholderia youngii]
MIELSLAELTPPTKSGAPKKKIHEGHGMFFLYAMLEI